MLFSCEDSSTCIFLQDTYPHLTRKCGTLFLREATEIEGT